ncbi:MAG: methionine synthase [Candidatus Cloacimonetes bacterium]|nr:methionine synthase [Candidatus Cloacimonadota bacterium]
MISLIFPKAAQFLPDVSLVLSEMGYCPPHNDHLQNLIVEKLVETCEHTEIKAGFFLLPPKSVKIDKQIYFDDQQIFDPGAIIISQMAHSTSLALLLATLGDEFDLWARSLAENDMLAAYIVDIIGSLLVEIIIDHLEIGIYLQAALRGEKCSNRFSPGYCQWLVEEQKQFFDLLPPEMQFVKLQKSSLMLPLKSVSAVIGLGRNVKKGEYHCHICTLQNCYRRKKTRFIL